MKKTTNMSDARIEHIRWQRTYLIVDLSEGCCEIPALLSSFGTLYRFSRDKESGCSSRFLINIAIAAGRDLLEEGVWTIVAASDGMPLPPSDGVMRAVEDFTRSFFFRGGKELYSVRFCVPDDIGFLRIELSVSFYRKDPHPRRDLGLTRVAKYCMNLFYKGVCVLHPKQGKRILFMSENNEQMTGNLKAISTRIEERGLNTEFEVEYRFRNIFSHRQSIVAWMATLNSIAKQDYIFVDDYVPVFAAIDLSPKTKLIQVWHAGFGFKAVGFGRFGIDESPNPFSSCHRKYSFALVGNSNLRKVYSEVFGIEEASLLATGMPRLDHFLDDRVRLESERNFDRRFPLTRGRHVILFAPTYRGRNQREACYDYRRIDFNALNEFCVKTNSCIVFKMHRFVTERVPIPDDFKMRMFDGSDLEINPLFYSADVLVTDYSSCFYDYLLLDKPVVFYCYDSAFYAATRGVHRAVEDVAPGPVCTSFEDVLKCLAVALSDPPKVEAASFLRDRCFTDEGSTASDRVIDTVLLGRPCEGVCLK